MAQKTAKFLAIGVQHATFATFITNLNTQLATFEGSGVPGDANQYKSVQKVDTFHDGTNYCAVISYTDSNTAAS